MAVNCPHCRRDVGETKDPSEFPWEDGEFKSMDCTYCNEQFFVRAVTSIRWEVAKDEEELDML